MDQGWAEIAPDVRENTRAALEVLERRGAIVAEIDLGLDVDDRDLRTITEKAILAGPLGGELAELAPRRDELTTTGRYIVDLATTMGPRMRRMPRKQPFGCIEPSTRRCFSEAFPRW
jgi:Asp-tRNA(Asn)/Glu-tRNA(Gln) amidotransferase A subunit family amidase